jgi:hypothetical protein
VHLSASSSILACISVSARRGVEGPSDFQIIGFIRF